MDGRMESISKRFDVETIHGMNFRSEPAAQLVRYRRMNFKSSIALIAVEKSALMEKSAATSKRSVLA
jgi:hypothetical protein